MKLKITLTPMTVFQIILKNVKVITVMMKTPVLIVATS